MTEVMQSGKFQWGDVEVEFIYDPTQQLTVENFEKSAFITYKSAEALLGWQANSARKKVSAKSLKASQGEGLTLGKKTVSDSAGRKNTMGVMDFETFHRVVQWQGFDKGNPAAKALLVAGYRDSIRSIALEQITGSPLSVEERNRQIQKDRDEFYKQYAAGISDEEWLSGNSVGSFAGLDFSKESHVAMFAPSWQPEFMTSAALNGQDIDEVLEELRAKYEH